MEFHVLQISNLWNYSYVSDSRLWPFRSYLPATATKFFKERLSNNELLSGIHRMQTTFPIFGNYSKYNKRLITDNRQRWENTFLRTDKKNMPLSSLEYFHILLIRKLIPHTSHFFLLVIPQKIFGQARVRVIMITFIPNSYIVFPSFITSSRGKRFFQRFL